MNLNFYKNNYSLFLYKSIYLYRQLVASIAIVTSLFFVLLSNIDEIRYVTVQSEDGNSFVLDRFTNKIKKYN